ncbi:hypothetical protein A6A08_21380 [Nocardiopsis sp. TSRI0078]|uniref:hypothetical protein n=1 Tax=unclassified Nocardiopsis TaxID=2649073 RepID=UPI00093E69F8|nr:hypothetical protein [Nocardiopsis sp. TSRI0078]OKI21338.1 hypothetical protein A6A08_21380 [Nocardiopsis sp. TSRI0078]
MFKKTAKDAPATTSEPARLPHRWAIILIGSGGFVGAALLLGAAPYIALGVGVTALVGLHQILD